MRSDRPDHVAVVGAGIVGLSTAWFLQSHGVQVTVVERHHVAAGSSWGNAGWITPGMVSPLPDPAILRYGVSAVVRPRQPVFVSAVPRPRLLAFLASFARNCSPSRWRAGMSAFAPIAALALAGYDELAAGGVDSPVLAADPMLAGYRSGESHAPLVDELATARSLGASLDYDVVAADVARQDEPTLSAAVQTVVRISGQRYLDPAAFTETLAEQVRSRGASMTTGVEVLDVRAEPGRAVLSTTSGEVTADAVVLATGAWLPELSGSLGIRPRMQAGRGYSFVVEVDRPVGGSLYFPTARLACTPLPGNRLRVAGIMEFTDADAPLDQRRIRLVAAAAREFLAGVNVDDRTDEWVGSRPCTSDGLPLIGATRLPRVYVAGGHGMWGITLGPATGRLLAELIATGSPRPEIEPYDPRRGRR
jgi:D-amino-acid dehydrogenase